MATNKKEIKVSDLKPMKDAKGGVSRQGPARQGPARQGPTQRGKGPLTPTR